MEGHRWRKYNQCMDIKLNTTAYKFGQQAELVVAHIDRLAASNSDEGVSYRAYLQRLASLAADNPDDERLLEELENSNIQTYVAELAGDDSSTFANLMEIAGRLELALSASSQESS